MNSDIHGEIVEYCLRVFVWYVFEGKHGGEILFYIFAVIFSCLLRFPQFFFFFKFSFKGTFSKQLKVNIVVKHNCKSESWTVFLTFILLCAVSVYLFSVICCHMFCVPCIEHPYRGQLNSWIGEVRSSSLCNNGSIFYFTKCKRFTPTVTQGQSVYVQL